MQARRVRRDSEQALSIELYAEENLAVGRIGPVRCGGLALHRVAQCAEFLHFGKYDFAVIGSLREVVVVVLLRPFNCAFQLGCLFDEFFQQIGKLFYQSRFRVNRYRRRKGFLGESRFGELADKIADRRRDIPLRHVDHGKRFDVQLLDVMLQFNLVAGVNLRFGDNAVLRSLARNSTPR